MGTLGTVQLGKTGRSILVSADGRPKYKARGVTIDWSTVVAVGAQTELPDETTVPAGAKYLRYGQILTRIGASEVQTVTFTGGPTAGSTILTFAETAEWAEEETSAIPWNATAQQFQDALVALARFQLGGVLVTRAGAGSAGSPYVYTITYDAALGNVVQPTGTHTFTGGTAPTVTPATTTPGAGTNKFGPYDPAASDGRQTLSRGNCYILNKTVLEAELGSDHPGAMEGGLLWPKRVLMTTGSASLAAGPTVANVNTAFPGVFWAE